MFVYIMGTTPHETAYELLGYANQGAGLMWLVATKLPLAFVIFGSLVALGRTRQGNLNAWATYMIGVVIIWTLFRPQTSVTSDSAVSAIEGEGIKVKQTTKEYIGRELDGEASWGFVLITNTMDTLVRRFIHIIEKIALGDPKEGMFYKPFGYLRIYMKMNESGIDDPAVRDQFNSFKWRCFYPAAKQLRDESPEEYERLTGMWDPKLLEMYKRMKYINEEGEEVSYLDDWKKLSENIDQLDKKEFEETKRLRRADDKLQDTRKNISRDQTVKDYLKRKSQRDDAFANIRQHAWMTSTWARTLKFFKEGKLTPTPRGAGSDWGAKVGSAGTAVTVPMLLGGMAVILANVLPVFKGFLEMAIYSLFPFVFLISLLPDSSKLLFIYFMSVLWLKCWALVWALINIAQIYGADFLMSMGAPSSGAKEAFFNSVTFPVMMFLAIISSPIIAGIVTWGSIQAISSVTGFTRGRTLIPKVG